MNRFAATLGILMMASPALAEGVTTYPIEGTFEEATFAVESAILSRGLVIDYVSHVGEMLARTGADVGSDITIFKAADVFLFCSAVTSRAVMEADPMNLAYCPYGIFVADTGAELVVGFRNFPEGTMQPAQDLLEGIVQEAVGK